MVIPITKSLLVSDLLKASIETISAAPRTEICLFYLKKKDVLAYLEYK